MLEVMVGLIVIPTAIIWVWNRVLISMNSFVWDAYRYTGIVGTPIHELSHAVACVLFGMKILDVSLYSPNPLTGTLGYVRFSYRPHSGIHALGRVVQGMAPMITSAVLLILVFSLGDEMGRPGSMPLHVWVWDSVRVTASSAGEVFFSGWEGALLVVGMSLLALHLIPSVSDIQVSLGGLFLVLAIVICLLIGLDFLQASAAQAGFATVMGVDIHYYMGVALDWVEAALWMGVLGATATVVMALLGSLLVIILPATLWYARLFFKGARGNV